MFNRRLIEQLKSTNLLLEDLTRIVKLTSGKHGIRLDKITEDLGELLEQHTADVKTSDPDPVPPFPEKAAARNAWGTLSKSSTDLNSKHDLGMAIAIPTQVWSKARITYDTVHLMGYVCPASKVNGSFDEANVIVVDRLGNPQRFNLVEFAKAYPYFYRVSRI